MNMKNSWNKVFGIMVSTPAQAIVCWLSVMMMVILITSDNWVRFFAGCLAMLGLIQAFRIHLLEQEIETLRSSKPFAVRKKTAKGK